MRILVTGANGQVGSVLKQKLSGKKKELLALTREALDITDEIAVNKIVSSFNPDIIINCAAFTAVDKAESEELITFKINRDGPKYLAKAASEFGAAIIHISTDYVFEGNNLEAYAETDPVNPQGVYGASKLAGENAVSEKCEKHIILRTAWVFGEQGDNFVKTMLRLGSARDSLGIVGDQFGGPTYSGDIANAIIKIINRIEHKKDIAWGIYHFSGIPYVSWFEFAEFIFLKAKHKNFLKKAPKLTSIGTNEFPTPAKRPENSKLDCKKIKAQFDVVESDWKKALENIIAYK